MAETPTRSVFDRVLGLFSEVRPGESRAVLLLLLNIFLVLAAYYVLKTVREPLVLATGGAELKTYAAAAQALVLIGFVPVYSWASSTFGRIQLLVGLSLFFVVCIELFYLAAQVGVPYLGFFFYVWVGIFSVAVIAQFWSYANDLYSRDQGERLFPVVGIGATLGGVAGAKLAEQLFKMGVGAYEMLHVAAILLLATLGLYVLIERSLSKPATPGEPSKAPNKTSIEGPNGLSLVLRSPYLRLLALMLILLNLVNTNGEYILASMVTDAAASAVAADPTLSVEAYVGAFYGSYFYWVNIGTVLIQAFLVSRIVKFAGIAGVVLALPLVALGAYSLIAVGAGLAVVRWAKSAENMTDYSVMNTAKAMLWLPTSRAEKYKAKQAVDTFFVRLGDVGSALLVYAGTLLAFTQIGFVAINLVVIVIWLFVAWRVLRAYRALAATAEPAP